MPSDIIRRIAAQTGMPELFSALAEGLPASDLQSLMLEVYRSRARGIRPASLAARAEQALFHPSSVDARLMNDFDRMAFAAAAGFDAVELSPVCPLGTHQVLAGIDQNNVLTGIRNADVPGDSTVAMAVECASRRKRERQATPVRLCTSQRMIRLQSFDFPGFTPHFRLFAMVSSGRDTGSNLFEMVHLREHISVYLKLFRGLNAEGFLLKDPLVELSDVSITEALLADRGVTRGEIRESVRAHLPGSSERFLAERKIKLPESSGDPAEQLQELGQRPGLELQVKRLSQIWEQVVEPLHAQFPEAGFRFTLDRLEGLGYYTGLCLRISPAAPDGVRYPVVDGGFTDWTARLLEDKKERLLTSGIGSEFVCKRYHPGKPASAPVPAESS